MGGRRPLGHVRAVVQSVRALKGLGGVLRMHMRARHWRPKGHGHAVLAHEPAAAKSTAAPASRPSNNTAGSTGHCTRIW